MPSVNPSGAALATYRSNYAAGDGAVLDDHRLAEPGAQPLLIRRAITSTAEPAGNGTIIRSGRSGQSAGTCANATPALVSAKTGNTMSASANRIVTTSPNLLCDEGCTAVRPLSSRLTRPATPAE